MLETSKRSTSKLATKRMRQVRKDRADKTDYLLEACKRLEDKERRLQRDYAEMRKVVSFFVDNYPKPLSEAKLARIDAELFDGKGSRNSLGVINVLARVAGDEWPDWVQVAKRQFGIDW